RSNAERPRDIAGSEHDAAVAAAHDHRLVGKARIVALFDGGIEGVAIDVSDGERIDVRMAQQARRAAGGATADLLRQIAAAIAAEARQSSSRLLRHRAVLRQRLTACRAPNGVRRWYHALPWPSSARSSFPRQ